MKGKLIEPISICVSSFLLVIFGLFLLTNSNKGMSFILIGAKVILIVLGLIMILSIFIKREDTILSSIIGGTLYLFKFCIQTKFLRFFYKFTLLCSRYMGIYKLFVETNSLYTATY